MRFLAEAGAGNALGEMRRVLDLRAVDSSTLAGLRAEAQAEASAADYHLVSWTSACPEEFVADYAALIARMSTDAPVGDLSIEAEVWDETRVADARR